MLQSEFGTGRVTRQIVARACWLYFGASVVLWLVLRQTGDRWWPATVFLFGPRWVWALPLIPLVGAAAFLRRRSLWVLLLSAWVVLFPVMGLCIPWRLAIPTLHGGSRLRVLTCNLQRQKADGLVAFVAMMKPDIVAIQEWSAQQNSTVRFEGAGWHCVTNGELLLASRYPIGKVEAIGGHDWPENGIAVSYELEPAGGLVHFINLHLASPHQPLELVRWRVPTAREKIGTNSLMRLVQSQIISVYADSLGPATLLSGDFNMPAGSAIQRRCLSRFSDAFSMAGFGFGYTYYTRRVSVRIDHILCAANWRCRCSWVGPNIGSSHRPLIADFETIRDH